MQRRIVVTGMGMLSPLGNNIEDSWQAILAGKSGVRLIDKFDTKEYPSKISGSVRNFEPTQYLSSKEVRKTDIFIQFGMAAAIQAIEDAELHLSEEKAPRIGVSIGSGVGGLPYIEDSKVLLLNSGPRKLSPFFIPSIIHNMASGNIAIKYGFQGPNICTVTACATSTHNIGLAARLISYGDADVMICGGTEMATTPLGVGGFSAMRALSTRNDDPEKASRPWDKDRDGFIMGDGAGVLVIEELEHAKKRGAKIYAELSGFAMTDDAYHMTSPDPEAKGGVAAMKIALQDGKVNLEEIDYINAHATSTVAGDETETLAIKKTFGDHAYQLAVSSTKSMTGHLLGAAGGVEAIFTILAIRDQVAPPTINLDNPSEGCDLNFVPHQPQSRKIQAAISNSFGFGGTNGSLLFKRFK